MKCEEVLVLIDFGFVSEGVYGDWFGLFGLCVVVVGVGGIGGVCVLVYVVVGVFVVVVD